MSEELMDQFRQNLKASFRSLRKNRGFSVIAILVLALGIGANTAIFSVVNAALLRPLPFRNPQRLVQIWHVPPQQSFPGFKQFAVSAANYVDWNSQNHVFDKMGIYNFTRFNLTGKGEPEAVSAATVSSDFFPVLGIQPKLGRTFAPGEDDPAHGHVAVLSESFWQAHFASDPGIVGKEITLDQEPYTVVGVMPDGFRLPSEARLWTPMAWTDKERAVRGEHHYSVIARLKPGVSLTQAQAEMNSISSNLEQEYPADDKGWGAVVVPLHEEMVGDLRPALLVLLGAVAFVLLIACANVANLVLAKTLARKKEIAIRTALGASRRQVVGQILTETVLLACLGGLSGLIIAQFGTSLIVAFLGDRLPQSIEVHLDVKVMIFALLISVLTGIAAGLFPALRLAGGDVHQALKEGLGRTDSDSGGNRARDVLVVSEIALSLVLLVGAGLMIRTLWTLRQVDPGLDPHNVVTMNVSVSRSRFDTPVEEANFFHRILENVRGLPGVKAAGVIDDLPLNGGGSSQPIAVEGRPVVPMSEQPEVAVRVISPGYLKAMSIPLLRGREVTDADTADHPATLLVSESLAQRFWPNQDPLGKHVTLTFFPDRVREVAGVVGDVKQVGLADKQPTETLYVPLAQVTPPAPQWGTWQSSGLSLAVRTSNRPEEMVASISRAIRQVDPEVPLDGQITMQDFIAESLSPQRLNMLLLIAFSGLALLLAAIGIYSLLAYSVRRRVREIGIRMALGARGIDVLRMIIGQGARLVLTGIAIGLAISVGLTRLMASQLFGVKATDPLTLAGVVLLLVANALIACYIPARRASRIDPMVALRYE